jgi:hypothetical protein
VKEALALIDVRLVDHLSGGVLSITVEAKLPRNAGDWHRNRGSTAMVTGVAVYDCRDTLQQTLPKSSTKHRNILN